MRHHIRLSILSAFGLVGTLVVPGAAPVSAVVNPAAPVFINELHYDNDGADVGEFIEVAGPAGTDLGGWTIELVNGSNGTLYGTIGLAGIVPDQDNGFGAVAVFQPGIQNGSPDGLALVDPDGVLVEFLSYEGSFNATAGTANGETSTDIGVSEAGSTPVGQSLGRTGSGSLAGDFAWQAPAAESPGAVNAGQTFGAVAAAPPFISEIHYDNDGGDVGEFFEIEGPAGTDLTGYVVELYNGSNGTSYNSISLAGIIDDEDGTSGALGFQLPANGLQNGSPDGLALIAPDATIIEFLSYEGAFAATDGPALGATSTDIGVSEPGSTPIGQSLQLIDGTWTGPATSSPGDLNAAGPAAPPFISEIHYDNDGGDVGEFFEIEGPAGTDLTGYVVELYNGSNGTSYNTIDLTGTIDDEDGTSGALDFPTAGLQNGSPDGIALIAPDATVIEFLSYEGAFAATDGPALGLSSTDIGVSEVGTTPIGESLQLIDGTWTGPAAASPGTLNTAIVEPPQTVLIHDIQGAGDASPLAGQTVVISGIVVGDFQEVTTAEPTDEPLDGYFVQEEDADADADPATSEGIFVFAPGGAPVAVGDLVEVTGTVTEFFTLTEIGNVSAVNVVSSGNTLPTPATPTVPTSLDDPTVDWEAIEGMSVSFTQPLFVSNLFPLGSYGEVGLSAIGPLDHPNQVAAVGSTEAADVRQLNINAQVLLDDGEDENESFPNGIPTWNPTPTPYLDGAEGTLRGGDVVNNLAGVVHFSFGEFEVQPVNVADPTNPDGAVDITRTPRPTEAPDVGGDLQVASFNVLNYFTTIDTGGAQCGPPDNPQGCRGADTQAEFDLQSAKISSAIAQLDADIVGLIELQNSGDDEAIADLVAKVNALSDRTYTYVPTGFIGTDAITVGFIFDPAVVSLDGAFATLDSSVSPAFIDDKSRPALAQTFTDLASGSNLTVAVNHLKSKGSSCDDVVNPGDPTYGVAPYALGADADVNAIGDPLFTGNCNLTRTAASLVLGQWLESNPTGAPSENLLILGDLNAYANEDPITVLEAQGYTDLNEASAGSNTWADGAHSYVFDGEFGTLDYALANPSLTGLVTGAAAWHINADEPFAIDYQNFNPDGQATPTPWKSSDHDPVLVGITFVAPGPTCNGMAATIIGTEDGEFIRGTSGDDVIVGLGGNDLIFGRGGNDVICGGSGRDYINASSGDDIVNGEDGNDVIVGGSGDDALSGDDGRDLLVGGRGADDLSGGDGNDILIGGSSDDVLDGGAGYDVLSGGSGTDTCTTGEWLASCELPDNLAP